jgi:DNA polymerase III delta prime subunit
VATRAEMQASLRPMSGSAPSDPTSLLRRCLESQRIHSAFLLSGPGEAPRQAALDFARGIACTGEHPRPCEQCSSCARSQQREPVRIDGKGKQGPLFRNIGNHADLFWVERGEDDTRVSIKQVRGLQQALRLAANEGSWRAVVIADAEWLNHEAQNALLHLLEEPPQRTCLILVAAGQAALLATIRSRCQRVVFPEQHSRLRGEDLSEDECSLVNRLDGIEGCDLPELLDWGAEYRGPRASAAARVQTLLALGSDWLRERVKTSLSTEARECRRELDAFKTLSGCRKDLAQRNANPQMVAERALLAIRAATGRWPPARARRAQGGG